MIDPEDVTRYDLDRAGLEEHALFWSLVSGKTADVVARALDRILTELRVDRSSASPFEAVRAFTARNKNLRALLKRHGIGCHGRKAVTVRQLADSGLDLSACALTDLTGIHGIGLKTACCFLMHTRRDSGVVGLDTHMLAELRARGYPAPRQTPSSVVAYERWAEVVRSLARDAGMTLAAFDLHVFNARHRRCMRDGSGKLRG